MDKGESTAVTAEKVKVPGSIGEAGAQPIEFNLGNHTYMAYTQEHKPNFNTTPAKTASTMSIVELSSNHEATITEAHLDKARILVDENQKAVGYSTGGDVGK